MGLYLTCMRPVYWRDCVLHRKGQSSKNSPCSSAAGCHHSIYNSGPMMYHVSSLQPVAEVTDWEAGLAMEAERAVNSVTGVPVSHLTRDMFNNLCFSSRSAEASQPNSKINTRARTKAQPASDLVCLVVVDQQLRVALLLLRECLKFECREP